MKKLLLRSLLAILILHFSVGCGSIVHGTTQDVQINSSPDEAEIWIDGARMGTTPTNITLKRKGEYLVTIKKDGYKEATVKIAHETSSWIIGNIIFGGIIGCGIDFLNGGAYDLTPERLDVSLTKLSNLDGQTLLIPDKYYNSVREIRFLDDNGIPQITITIKPE